MTSNINWYKVALFVAAAIAIFLFGRSCGVHSVLKKVGSDTIIRKDSFIIVEKPMPYRVDSLIFVNGKPVPYPVHDTTPGQIVLQPSDTAAILKDYFAMAYYKDVIDTPTIKRGKLTIWDTVTRNRIAGRKVKLEIPDTTINNTTALLPPKKIVGFYGLDLYGTPQSPLSGIGASLGVKLSNDTYFGVKAFTFKKEKIVYGFEYKRPIHLFGKK